MKIFLIGMNRLLDFKWPIHFFLCVLVVIFPMSLSAGNLKNVSKDKKYAMSVSFNKHSNSYRTTSRTVGSKKYKIKTKELPIATFGKVNVKLNISTYKEFLKTIEDSSKNFKYFDKFTMEIANYLKLLNVNNFDLGFKIIVLPEEYGLLFKSQRKSADDQIELTFVASMPDNALEYSAELFELNLIRILPHELFHFLVNFKSFDKMNQLRNETYAQLFGQCVSYELNPLIHDDMTLNFPKYFFKNPAKDIVKVYKKMKNDKLVKDMQFPKSFLGGGLARYYFQAVADNHTGENIHSDKIPKFCHKLFSEHNFKHPIEKKPPVWFREFLAE